MPIKINPVLKGRVMPGPLGVLTPFAEATGISEDSLRKLEFIDQFDMERERKLVAIEECLDDYHSHLYIREFKRFFALELLYPKSDCCFLPSREIDPVWHHLVLDSRRYVDLCEKTYGGYVHHTPEDTCPDAYAGNAGAKYGYTKSCLNEAFGGALPAAWGVAAYIDGAACAWH